MLQEQSPPFNPVDNTETIIPWTHYLSRSSTEPIRPRDPKCSPLAFQKNPCVAEQGRDGTAHQREIEGEGSLLLRTEGRRGIVIDPPPCPTVRIPHIHFQTFFWVTRYGTLILQCKDYASLSCTASAWGIKKWKIKDVMKDGQIFSLRLL